MLVIIVNYRTIDALDASQGMLDVLKEEANGIYGRVMLNSIGIKPVVEVRAGMYLLLKLLKLFV